MISLSAKIINGLLGLLNAKKMVEKAFNNQGRRNKALTITSFSKYFVVTQFQVKGKSVITIKPKNSKSIKHVIFLHGGAYLLEGSFLHFRLMKKIAASANCKISYIDYPLAPEFNYKNTFEMLQQAYNQLATKFSGDQFILMGDSAGGGLALAFAQKLVKENASVLPVKNILFSPWLDISMKNPTLMYAERTDKILPLSGLIDAGKKYADGDDVNHFLLSPINGEFDRVGDTIVFFGSDELFYPDCKKLEMIVKNSNANFKFYEYSEMQHDWVLLPIPEARKAINTAIEFIKN